MNDMNANRNLADSASESHMPKHDTHPQAAQALHGGKDTIMRDLRTVIDDAQALLRDAVKLSTESVPAYVEDKARLVKENLQRARTAVEERTKQATAATETYVRENPLKAIGYVAVASALVSFLFVRACGYDLINSRREKS
jgi:ElaB/YqjD/DUF883 family membrane-anchored ribosome-binding protein